MMMRAVVATLIVLLCGCATRTTLPPIEQGPVSSAQEATYYQVRIPSHDGIMLSATVYQPELEAGETAPLIIATHGYGGFRAKRPNSIYGRGIITGRAAIKAWEAGYWVVFYDQRGFGNSQDKVNVMHLDKEVRDPSNVLDWALDHLPGVATLSDGNPAVGMIGESYGGGAQILASFEDPRLKALVPIAAWYDLGEGLAPNNHIRTNWGAILFTLPAITSRFSTQGLSQPWRSGFGGTMKQEMEDALYSRSPVSFCEQGYHPKGDALLIQGFRDTIMTLDQALDNRECFDEGGNDVRLMAIQGGHILPWPVQRWSGLPLFNTDRSIDCTGEQQSPESLILAWWDEKLRDGDQIVPEMCVTLGYKESFVVNDLPLDGKTFSVPRSHLHIPFAGLFEGFMVPADIIGDSFRRFWTGVDLRYLEPDGGFGRPKFIPLYTVERDDEILLGIPEISLMLGGTANRVSTRVFVGVGVQGMNQRRVRVASEQIIPLPAKGNYQQELPPVSMPLKRGDRVGLVVYGFNWQYFFNASRWWSQATVQGNARLPITVRPDTDRLE